MNKADIKAEYTRFVKISNLMTDEVALGFGGAMVMMGLREQTSDLDLDIPQWCYNMFVRFGFPVSATPMGQCLQLSDQISLHAELPNDCIFVEGVFVYNPMRLLSTKEFLAIHPDRIAEKKEQDLKDIEQLRSYIAKM